MDLSALKRWARMALSSSSTTGWMSPSMASWSAYTSLAWARASTNSCQLSGMYLSALSTMPSARVMSSSSMVLSPRVKSSMWMASTSWSKAASTWVWVAAGSSRTALALSMAASNLAATVGIRLEVSCSRA